MNAVFLGAFILGAAGSAHCIGMCGPIALAVPTTGPGRLPRARSTLILNSGRITMYALIGALFGSVGAGLRLTGLQQGLSIIAGFALLLSSFIPGMLERWIPTSRAALFVGRLRSTLARNLGRTGPAAIFFTGLLNGLLPCGLVYAAAIGAAAMGTALQGALFMVLFGLGTWPLLVALRMSGSMIGGDARAWLRRVSPVLVAVVGLLLILRGLDLGIPILSPSMVVAPAGVNGCH